MKTTERKIYQCIARGCEGCTVCTKPPSHSNNACMYGSIEGFTFRTKYIDSTVNTKPQPTSQEAYIKEMSLLYNQ